MSHENGGSQQSISWRIDRFELIFYNSRYRRWQYFAEGPVHADSAPGRGLHRKEITSLLNTLRNAFRKLVGDSHQRAFELPETLNYATTVQIEPPAAAAKDSLTWKAYLEYLLKTADREGIPDQMITTLTEWVNHPDNNPSFPLSEVLTLLSLVPIMEDWDVWGCLHRAFLPSSGRRIDKFGPQSENEIWSKPFSIIELAYSAHDTSRTGCNQIGLLKDHVAIEGICQDLAGFGGNYTSVPRAGFFDNGYCRRPMVEQSTLYRYYSHIIDPIFQSTDEEDRRFFVITYPITVAGRLHFLQVALSCPLGGDMGVTDLWKAWKVIHNQFWTTEFRLFLFDEMLRIINSAFQNEVSVSLTPRESGETPVYDPVLSMLRHIYHLLPIEQAQYGCKLFSYGTPQRGRRVHSATGNLISLPEWTVSELSNAETEEGESIELAVNKEIKKIIVKTATSSVVTHAIPLEAIRLLETHRTQQVIDQQFNFVNNLIGAFHDESRRREQDRIKCALIVQRVLATSEAIRGGIRRASERVPEVEIMQVPVAFEGIEVRDDFLPDRYKRGTDVNRVNSFGRFFRQAYPDYRDEAQLHLLKSLCQPSLPLLLSEYFDTGIVKRVTHEYDNLGLFSGTAQEALAHADFLFKQIHTRVSAPEAPIEQQEAICSLVSFHQVLQEHVRSKGATLSGHLESLRKELEYKTLDMHGAISLEGLQYKGLNRDLRFYGLRPDRCLAEVICAYRQHTSRHTQTPNREMVHLWMRREDIRYSSAHHTDAQYPVHRIDHWICLPYSIRNLKGWPHTRLAQKWFAVGRDFGSLYYISAEDSSQVTATLLVVYPKNNKHAERDSEFGKTFISAPSFLSEIRKLRPGFPEGSYLVIELQHWLMQEP